VKIGFRRKSSEALIYTGAEGRTRTGTPSLTADFEFLQGVLGQYSTKLNTTFKIVNITDVRSVFNWVFRPVSPHAVWALCVQKMFKNFTKELPVFNRRQQIHFILQF
jgi:hypothetical protein